MIDLSSRSEYLSPVNKIMPTKMAKKVDFLGSIKKNITKDSFIR